MTVCENCCQSSGVSEICCITVTSSPFPKEKAAFPVDFAGVLAKMYLTSGLVGDNQGRGEAGKGSSLDPIRGTVYWVLDLVVVKLCNKRGMNGARWRQVKGAKERCFNCFKRKLWRYLRSVFSMKTSPENFNKQILKIQCNCY